MLLFLPYYRSDQTFYSQTKVNSKTSKDIASRCYTWNLGSKKSLNGQGSVNQVEKSSAQSRNCKLTFHSRPLRLIGYKHFPECFFNSVRFCVIIPKEIDLKPSSTYRCPFYWESKIAWIAEIAASQTVADRQKKIVMLFTVIIVIKRFGITKYWNNWLIGPFVV